MAKVEKRYLGDGVYADFDGWHIVLTTENGGPPNNTICLDEEVYSALLDFSKDLQASLVEAHDGNS